MVGLKVFKTLSYDSIIILKSLSFCCWCWWCCYHWTWCCWLAFNKFCWWFVIIDWFDFCCIERLIVLNSALGFLVGQLRALRMGVELWGFSFGPDEFIIIEFEIGVYIIHRILWLPALFWWQGVSRVDNAAHCWVLDDCPILDRAASEKAPLFPVTYYFLPGSPPRSLQLYYPGPFSFSMLDKHQCACFGWALASFASVLSMRTGVGCFKLCTFEASMNFSIFSVGLLVISLSPTLALQWNCCLSHGQCAGIDLTSFIPVSYSSLWGSSPQMFWMCSPGSSSSAWWSHQSACFGCALALFASASSSGTGAGSGPSTLTLFTWKHELLPIP